LIFFITNLFQPVDGFAIEPLQNRDVSHSSRWCRAVPVLFTRRTPDDIAGSNLFLRLTFALHPSASRRDNQRLTERMGVPRGSSTGLECNAHPKDSRRVGCVEQRIDAYVAGKVFFGSLS